MTKPDAKKTPAKPETEPDTTPAPTAPETFASTVFVVNGETVDAHGKPAKEE